MSDRISQSVVDRAGCRLLVVDDHKVFAHTLAEALGGLRWVAEVSWATSREQALDLLDERDHDVALVDLRVPGVEGAGLVAEISGRVRAPAVVVLSILSDERSIIGAFEAGAVGFMSKSDDFEVVGRAVEAASRGEAPISPSIFSRILPRLIGGGGDGMLTEREQTVLLLLGQGKTNPAIAELLDVSANTVRNHVYSLMRKLQAGSRNEAVEIARGRQLIPPS